MLRLIYCLLLLSLIGGISCSSAEEITPLPYNVFEDPIPSEVLQFTSFETNRSLRGVWTYFEFDGSIFTPDQLDRLRVGVRTPLDTYILGLDVGRTIEQYSTLDDIDGDLPYELFLVLEDGTAVSETLDELIIRFD